MKPFSLLGLASLLLQECRAHAVGGKPGALLRGGLEGRAALQNIVTWDQHSLLINGERIMIFSGEFHPFRLPVPSLWLDVFQKVKALGFNCVSFYVHWALLEGKPGSFSAAGVLALEPFFDAALKAGVYLIARPGPYINAEASGGGYPGWLQRVKGVLRTSDPGYLAATDNYVQQIAQIIAKGQITNGGPVILYQPENEYTSAQNTLFPDGSYMQYVEDQARKAGIVVPLMSNDAHGAGNNAPGTGKGEVDVYGHDGYPLGFDCARPTVWPAGNLPTWYRSDHLRQSPMTPYTIPEFQGGSFDPWGGWGFEQCSSLVNHEFQRVFYKNNMAAGVSIFSIYMIFGGTNWGNLGHPGGYTSYDYGSVIKEDGRTVTREKYSELKLEAQFLRVSRGYLTATPGNLQRAGYGAPADITVTPLLANASFSNGTGGSFFVVRQSNYATTQSTPYNLTLPTSLGNITVPQLGGSLVLNGRDSKFHVVDYPVGSISLLYSTAEILTWKQFEDVKLLVVYGGPAEMHEVAIKTSVGGKIVEGKDVAITTTQNATILNFATSPARRVVQVGDLFIHVVDRNRAYNYWVPDLPGQGAMAAFGTAHLNPASLVVYGGYLVRSAAVSGDALHVKADFNTSTTLEIYGVPRAATKLVLNDAALEHTVVSVGATLSYWRAEVPFVALKLAVPDLRRLPWAAVDSLPEVAAAGYDDARWPVADRKATNNTANPLHTPTSLYASDYGFHVGTLVYRGRFVVPPFAPPIVAAAAVPETTTTAVLASSATASASGASASPAGGAASPPTADCTLELAVQGGSAFAFGLWLNGSFVGSWGGTDAASAFSGTAGLSDLVVGVPYVFTAVVDTTGLDENWLIGSDMMKNPRGLMRYGLRCWPGAAATTGTTQQGSASQQQQLPPKTPDVPIAWRLTGNLGGEDFADRARGPLNEGGLFAERMGFHLPAPPTARFSIQGDANASSSSSSAPAWLAASPFDGIKGRAGIAYFTAPLTLDLPADKGFDIPVAFTFVNDTASGAGGGGGSTGGASKPKRSTGVFRNTTSAAGSFSLSLKANGTSSPGSGGPEAGGGPYRAILYVNGWQFGRYASNIGPQTTFPVPEGILNYAGTNWIGLLVWALDDRGAAVPDLYLTVGTPVNSGRDKVQLVESPAWVERQGAY